MKLHIGDLKTLKGLHVAYLYRIGEDKTVLVLGEHHDLKAPDNSVVAFMKSLPPSAVFLLDSPTSFTPMSRGEDSSALDNAIQAFQKRKNVHMYDCRYGDDLYELHKAFLATWRPQKDSAKLAAAVGNFAATIGKLVPTKSRLMTFMKDAVKRRVPPRSAAAAWFKGALKAGSSQIKDFTERAKAFRETGKHFDYVRGCVSTMLMHVKNAYAINMLAGLLDGDADTFVIFTSWIEASMLAWFINRNLQVTAVQVRRELGDRAKGL
jgi:hypothetical protein